MRRTRRQALGQHFLHHQPTIEKIIAASKQELEKLKSTERAAKCILEIGPGKLALTKKLQDLAVSQGLRLTLVERDLRLESELKTLAEAQVHFMDAATEELSRLISNLAESNQTPILLVSNLPYSASSQILAQMCQNSKHLSSCIVMVQKELACRMIAPPGGADRGAFSLLMQSYFKMEALFDVGPGAFNPPPQVMSTVLKLDPILPPLVAEIPSPKGFEQFCKKLFTQRRKMIRNLIEPEKHMLFAKLGISGTERPQELSLQTVLQLYMEAN